MAQPLQFATWEAHMKRSFVLGAVLAVLGKLLVSPSPAWATITPVPEPGSLTLLSSGIVAGVLVYRFIRRR